MERTFGVREIIARAVALILPTLPASLPAFLGLCLIGFAFDFYPALSSAITMVNLGATIIAQYLVTRAAMRASGLPLSDRRGTGKSVFGAAIAIGLASGLGLIALIVPGVYLYARWALAMPIILGENERMSDAMRLSSERTRGHIVPIALALVIVNLPWLASMWALYFVYPAEGEVSLPLSILTSVGIYSAYLASWLCMVAAYVLLRPSHELEEVFA